MNFAISIKNNVLFRELVLIGIYSFKSMQAEALAELLTNNF